jgi:hypothetical protein
MLKSEAADPWKVFGRQGDPAEEETEKAAPNANVSSLTKGYKSLRADTDTTFGACGVGRLQAWYLKEKSQPARLLDVR